MKQINKRKTNDINNIFNFLSKGNEQNANNNLINSCLSLNKNMALKGKEENEIYII